MSRFPSIIWFRGKCHQERAAPMKTRLTDSSGRWFDPDKSRRTWEKLGTDDEVYRDIRGDDTPDAGERLYLTFDGTFVLCYWNSNYSQDAEYRTIDIDEAAIWLGSNGYHAALSDPALDMSHEAKQLDLDNPKGF
jgi:hypothetical protein